MEGADNVGNADQKVMNRGLVVVGAILIQLCLGAIYAWSVFTPPLSAKEPSDVEAAYKAPQLGLDQADYDKMAAELSGPKQALARVRAAVFAETDQAKKDLLKAEQKLLAGGVNTIVRKYVPDERLRALAFGFNNTQTQAVFAAGLAAFAVVMVVAGRMMPKVGPRKLVIAGGLVLGAGYALAGLINGTSVVALLILIGIVGGAGIGLGYVVPIAVGVKWFPDKKGLITGLAVAGFGFGALLWIQLAGSWGQLIARNGLGATFIIYGVTFAVACVIGSLWMKNPPEGWRPPGWSPPAPSAGGKAHAGSIDFTSSQMLAKPQFYMIFLCFAVGAGAGLMSIGLMKSFPPKALVTGGVDPVVASGIAGTAMAVFFSLANGLGRIIWGTISDKLGRKSSILLMLAAQGVLVICFQWMAGNEYLLYLGSALIGFNFGGNFALFPTITADTFGTKYLAQNYGWVFLSYGVGGIAGPLLGGALGDMGNFPLAFTICGVLCLVAAGVIVMVRHPKVATRLARRAAPQAP